ncbi:hypothetical protein A4D02_11975 [Niastella koreensis]|uniref:Uncharacterized protein n=2 Tax=Niastella koreensis TaxID=354356 RepID=G8TH55_NIAKG|nr:hypothetical protein [Niastella koreensis]AEW00666.1 hypothetical protein Niako_4407 [Niastella koreensis GR20-10]OQP42297.1 hypothetical protein A4D02_11975 [Niastella koreensis]
MACPKEFTNIFVKDSKNRGLHLVFYNRENKNALLYDGIFFAYNLNVTIDEKQLTELNYSLNNKNGNLKILSVRNDYDICFIVFESGDIFQLSYMMDDENSPQRLFIHKPGSESYLWALKSADRYEEDDIPQDTSVNYQDWYNRGE